MVTSLLPLFLPKMHWHVSSTDISNYFTFFLSPLFKWTHMKASRTWREVCLPCWINSLCRFRCWQDRPCIQESGKKQAEPRQEEWLGGCPFSHSQWAAREQSVLTASTFPPWMFFHPLGLAFVTITPSESAFAKFTKNWLPNLVDTQYSIPQVLHCKLFFKSLFFWHRDGRGTCQDAQYC